MNIWNWFQILGVVVLLLGLTLYVMGAFSGELAPHGWKGLALYAVGMCVMWGSTILEHDVAMDRLSKIYTPDVEPQKPSILKE